MHQSARLGPRSITLWWHWFPQQSVCCLAAKTTQETAWETSDWAWTWQSMERRWHNGSETMFGWVFWVKEHPGFPLEYCSHGQGQSCVSGSNVGAVMFETSTNHVWYTSDSRPLQLIGEGRQAVGEGRLVLELLLLVQLLAWPSGTLSVGLGPKRTSIAAQAHLERQKGRQKVSRII